MISIDIADDMLAVFLIGVMTAIVLLKSSPFLYWIWQKVKGLKIKYQRKQFLKKRLEQEKWQESKSLCFRCGGKLSPNLIIKDDDSIYFSVGRLCPNKKCNGIWRSKGGMTKTQAEEYLKEKVENNA